jgi:hypothetical protein
MEKQSSIDWLEQEFIKLERTIGVYGIFYELLGKAKEMEKEQIIHAYNQSWHFRDKPYETAEQYYNETFGGKI